MNVNKIKRSLRRIGQINILDDDMIEVAPSHRQRLDHYGHGGNGWDEEAWARDYARPLAKKVKAALDGLDLEVSSIEIDEKGFAMIYLD